MSYNTKTDIIIKHLGIPMSLSREQRYLNALGPNGKGTYTEEEVSKGLKFSYDPIENPEGAIFASMAQNTNT
mgnify:CR=1 FL=1